MRFKKNKIKLIDNVHVIPQPIASDLNCLWENDWDIDSMIISGGGSIPLAEFLIPSVKGNVIPIPKTIEARFNNVQGYCKFGHYKWGKYKKHLPGRPLTLK